jgi:hypothetical protein
LQRSGTLSSAENLGQVVGYALDHLGAGLITLDVVSLPEVGTSIEEHFGPRKQKMIWRPK